MAFAMHSSRSLSKPLDLLFWLTVAFTLFVEAQVGLHKRAAHAVKGPICDEGHGIFSCPPEVPSCFWDELGAFGCCKEPNIYECFAVRTCVGYGQPPNSQCDLNKGCISCTDTRVGACFTITNPVMSQYQISCAAVAGISTVDFTYELQTHPSSFAGLPGMVSSQVPVTSTSFPSPGTVSTIITITTVTSDTASTPNTGPIITGYTPGTRTDPYDTDPPWETWKSDPDINNNRPIGITLGLIIAGGFWTVILILLVGCCVKVGKRYYHHFHGRDPDEIEAANRARRQARQQQRRRRGNRTDNTHAHATSTGITPATAASLDLAGLNAALHAARAREAREAKATRRRNAQREFGMYGRDIDLSDLDSDTNPRNSVAGSSSAVAGSSSAVAGSSSVAGPSVARRRSGVGSSVAGPSSSGPPKRGVRFADEVQVANDDRVEMSSSSESMLPFPAFDPSVGPSDSTATLPGSGAAGASEAGEAGENGGQAKEEKE